MTIALLIVASLLLLFATYVVVMNWACVIVSISNKKRGIDRHHSTVPLVSLILFGMAYVIYPCQSMRWFGIVPLLDIANWGLLRLPFVLYREFRDNR